MISLNTGIQVTSANTPLDARTKVNSISNLTDGSIIRPYVGLIVWVTNEEKAYTITGVTGTLVTSYKPIGDDVDREYNSEINTKGYKVLKTNTPIDNLIADSNTIYEIRDNFDLKIGETVEIGELSTQVISGSYKYYKSSSSIDLSLFDEGDAIVALNNCIFLDSNNNELGGIIDLPSSDVVYLAKKTLLLNKTFTLTATATCSTAGIRTASTLESGMNHYLSSAITLKEGDVITPGSSEVLFDSNKQQLSISNNSYTMQSDDVVYIGTSTASSEIYTTIVCSRSINDTIALLTNSNINNTRYERSNALSMLTLSNQLIALFPVESTNVGLPTLVLRVPSGCVVLNESGTVIQNPDVVGGSDYTLTNNNSLLYTPCIAIESETYEGSYNIYGALTILPECVLEFNGGSIQNAILIGNNTKLDGLLDKSLIFKGSFILDQDISPVTFGLVMNDDTINASPYLAKCFELSNVSNVGVHIPKGNMYVMDSIDVSDYNFLSVKGEGFGSVVNVYNDFLVSKLKNADNSTFNTRAKISNFKITKVTGKGSGYYNGIVFKDFEFRGSEIDTLTVTYFGIFIKGGLHYNTVVENCNVEGLGYSFLSGIYCEDFDNNNFYDCNVSMDSSIRNNYINCVVKGSDANPKPNNRSLIFGFYTSSRFESNFVDFWKCVFDFNDYTISGRFKGNIIANNFFDRIFSLFIHPINLSKISLVSNQFYACKKSDNLTGNWSKTVDHEVIDANVWTMLRLDANRLSDFYIKDNMFDCNIIATVKSDSTTTFTDVITDSIESDSGIRDRIIYIPNTVNFTTLKANKYNFKLFNKKIYNVNDPSYSIFSEPYKYNQNLDNTAKIDFGDGYYPFNATMLKVGCYDYGFVKQHPEFIGIVKNDNDSYVYRNIGGVDRLVLQNANGKIKGVESKDVQDIINNIESESLQFVTPVLVMDKGVTMANLGADTKCYSMLFASTIINISSCKLIESSLPNNNLIINRAVLNTSDNKWYRYTYNGWEEDSGMIPIKSVGTTAERPKKYWRTSGTEYYDTDLNAFIVWDGDVEKWLYKDGGYEAVSKIGTTANKPNFTNDTNVGFEYYDTDLNKKIIWNGTAWTNLDGTPLV